MVLRKASIVAGAIACLSTSLPAMARGPGTAEPQPAAERAAGQAQLTDGFAAHWIVLAAIALGVAVLVVADGGDDPVSP